MATHWQDQLSKALASTPLSERAMKGSFFPRESFGSRAPGPSDAPTSAPPKNPRGTWESAEATPELTNSENWQRRNKPQGHIKRVGKGSTSVGKKSLVADDMSVNTDMEDPSYWGYDNFHNPGITNSGMAGESASAGRARARRQK